MEELEDEIKDNSILSCIYMEEMQKNIIDLERQLCFVKEDSNKRITTLKEKCNSLEKQNITLSQGTYKLKQEKEYFQTLCLDKEKYLQISIVQISSLQEDIKRLNNALNLKDEQAKKSSKEIIEDIHKNSKYSAKQFIAINTNLDAMRLQLNSERIERANEKSSLDLEISSLRNKLNYSELLVKELRDERSRSQNYSSNIELNNLNTLLQFHSNGSCEKSKTTTTPIIKSESESSIKSSSSSKVIRSDAKNNNNNSISGRSKSASPTYRAHPPLPVMSNQKGKKTPLMSTPIALNSPIRSLRGRKEFRSSNSASQTKSKSEVFISIKPNTKTNHVDLLVTNTSEKISIRTSPEKFKSNDYTPGIEPMIQSMNSEADKECMSTTKSDVLQSDSRSIESATEINYNLDSGFISDDDDEDEKFFDNNINSHDDLSTITHEPFNFRQNNFINANNNNNNIVKTFDDNRNIPQPQLINEYNEKIITLENERKQYLIENKSIIDSLKSELLQLQKEKEHGDSIRIKSEEQLKNLLTEKEELISKIEKLKELTEQNNKMKLVWEEKVNEIINDNIKLSNRVKEYNKHIRLDLSSIHNSDNNDGNGINRFLIFIREKIQKLTQPESSLFSLDINNTNILISMIDNLFLVSNQQNLLIQHLNMSCEEKSNIINENKKLLTETIDKEEDKEDSLLLEKNNIIKNYISLQLEKEKEIKQLELQNDKLLNNLNKLQIELSCLKETLENKNSIIHSLEEAKEIAKRNSQFEYEVNNLLIPSVDQTKLEEERELKQKLLRAEIRCELLDKQIKSIPSSLAVAQAEKRVLESKFQKALSAYESNMKSLEEKNLQAIHELQNFLKIEKTEKQELSERLKEQNLTIHQLTHHIYILKSNTAIADCKLLDIKIEPAPWDDKAFPKL